MELLKKICVVIILSVGISEVMASDIPTIYITTPDSTAITSRDYWKENSSLRIVMPDGSVVYESTEVAVKARGNSTFTKPKKPFALKLKERTDVVLLTGDSIYNRRALWYDRLLQDRPFLTRVKERWHKLEPRFRALANDIDRWQALIEKSAIADEQLWKGQDPARFDTFTSFHSSVSNLKQVYLYRIESLNKLLAK